MSACRYCKSPIEPGAARCRNCLGWQGKLLPDPQSPKGLLLFIGLLFLVMGPLIVFHGAFDAGPPIEALVITESVLNHQTCCGGRHYIAVIGRIRNDGTKSAKDPHFEVSFLDADGKLIDSMASDVYDLIIQAGKEVSFRVRDEAIQPESAYDSYEIKLTGIRGVSF